MTGVTPEMCSTRCIFTTKHEPLLRQDRPWSATRHPRQQGYHELELEGPPRACLGAAHASAAGCSSSEAMCGAKGAYRKRLPKSTPNRMLPGLPASDDQAVGEVEVQRRLPELVVGVASLPSIAHSLHSLT